MQDFTLHTHTIGFDGRNTPAQMIERASDAGMRAIGISNHFIVHPKIKNTNLYRAAKIGGYSAIYSESFSEVIDRFAPHYDELEKLAAASDIKVYRGMEVDFFDSPKWANGFSHACEILQPDYLIGATHLIEYNGGLCNMHDVKIASPDVRNKMLMLYWRNIIAAGESGLFTWLAHLDLPKKCGTIRDVDVGWTYWRPDWNAVHRYVIFRLGRAGAAIEINTTPFDKGQNQPYPSRSILEMVAEYDMPVLISDDAHCAEHVGRHFDRAEQFARDCGVKNFLSLQKILDFRNKTL